MATDGDIDFRVYTREQLDSVSRVLTGSAIAQCAKSHCAYDSLQLLQSVANDRLHAYELIVQGLRQHSHDGDKMVDDGLAELNRINDRVERSNASTTKP